MMITKSFMRKNICYMIKKCSKDTMIKYGLMRKMNYLNII